jgi:hypothetical protein
VPVDLSRRAAEQHAEIDYRELDDVDHFALIDPLSRSWVDTVLPAISP